MERKLITTDLSQFPEIFHPYLADAALYDSSCSPEARVYYIEKDAGFYLKKAARNTLETEAKMTAYFHSKGLGAEVLAYEQADADWLLTRRVPGEDCIHRQYLDDPKRLCETTATLLRKLHETDFTGCPVPNRTKTYLETVESNYRTGKYDTSLFPDNWGYKTAEEAWAAVQEFAPHLKADTLLHGDYCLPNILLDNWQFSGFIDVGCGGVGDKHIDLFWGAWTLRFNLKTDAWCSRFLDCYGRDNFDPEVLRAIAAFEVFG